MPLALGPAEARPRQAIYNFHLMGIVGVGDPLLRALRDPLFHLEPRFNVKGLFGDDPNCVHLREINEVKPRGG